MAPGCKGSEEEAALGEPVGDHWFSPLGETQPGSSGPDSRSDAVATAVGPRTVVQSLRPSGPLTVRWSSSGRHGQGMFRGPPWPQLWARTDSTAGAVAEPPAQLPPGR